MAVSRREFLKVTGGVLLTAACSDISAPEKTPENTPNSSVRTRLYSRPVQLFLGTPLAAGYHRITRQGTDIVAYVPESARNRPKVPLNLLLHASYRNVEQLVAMHKPLADADGVVVLAPYAEQGSWDAIHSVYGFGRDVTGIDRALSWMFDNMPIDPARVALTGFSDGATYSLGLGRANGDLFNRIVAYSPGFLIDIVPLGKPPIAISHGTADEELPYANTRDVIVPTLRIQGYSVDFHTFDGPHQVFPGLMQEVMLELDEDTPALPHS